jgi:hypothetical protein
VSENVNSFCSNSDYYVPPLKTFQSGSAVGAAGMLREDVTAFFPGLGSVKFPIAELTHKGCSSRAASLHGRQTYSEAAVVLVRCENV